MRKKYIILSLIFTVTALFLLQNLLIPKYVEDIKEGGLVREYYMEKGNHDVIFIGDCEVYESFSPDTLDKFGINSYIRGSASQTVWQSYYLLKEMLKKEMPKVVVFNVLAMKYDKAQKESYNRMTLDGMKWSSEKIEAIKASMLPNERFIDYIFPILRFHSRWSELKEEDFTYIFNKPKISTRGYLKNTGVKPMGILPKPKPLAEYQFSKKNYEYLDKITKLCKEKGIRLILIKAPILYPHWYDEWDRQITNYATKNNIEYINYIKLIKKIGIDFKKDTYDAGLHLNFYGAEKLSEYFGKYLK